MKMMNILMTLCLLFSSCTSSAQENPEIPSKNDDTTYSDAVLTIRLNFERSNTIASNQYAVWIENSVGKVVRTLYVSSFTANGGYRRREDCVPTWVAHAHPAQMSTDELDAISGATPRSGQHSYTWNGKDEHGNTVADGEYRICVEGTLYWSSTVLYFGVVRWGGDSQTIRLQPAFSEEAATNQDMITVVTAEYAVIPAK
mgnify:FL=1